MTPVVRFKEKITFVSEQVSRDLSFFIGNILISFRTDHLQICQFIRKGPDNDNALDQVIGGLNRRQAFTWINTDPVYRYAYAPL